MKNLAKLKLQQAQMQGKTKPMLSARTARAVPQMRKVAKQLTGYNKGGSVLRPKPTYKGKILQEKPIKKIKLGIVGKALRGFGKALSLGRGR